jgi:hypothetical protein
MAITDHGNIFNCLCFIHYTIEFNSELNKICDKGSDLFLKYLPISNQVIDRGGDIFPLFDVVQNIFLIGTDFGCR